MVATIASYFPLPVEEVVPHLYPSRYFIEASDGKHPKLLVVNDAYYILDNRAVEGQHIQGVKIPVPAEKLAASLVHDFKASAPHTTDEAFPAVFYVPKEVDAAELEKNYNKLIASHLNAQKLWFERLVRIADDDWQRYRMHRVITDMQRMAANRLNLDREWLTVLEEQKVCPACSSKVNIGQVICHNCRYILNEAAYKNMKFAGV